MLATPIFQDTIGAGTLCLAVVMAVLAWPAWRIALTAKRADQHAREVAEIAGEVRTLLVGDDEVKPRTPANPSLIDVMSKIEENTRRYVDLADELDEHTRNPQAHGRHG